MVLQQDEQHGGTRVLPLIIVIAGCVVYANSINVPFVFDDKPTILENTYLRSLTPPSNLFQSPPRVATAGRPMVSLTLALNYAIGEYNVVGYHIANLIIHITTALFLFGTILLVIHAYGDHSTGTSRHALAFCITLLWLVHPLQTESVTYISTRTESLMGCFFLCALYCALRSHWSPSRQWQWLCVTSCAMGMATKEVMVTLPVIVMLFDWLLIMHSLKECIRRRWKLYAALMGTWVILAALVIYKYRALSFGDIAGPHSTHVSLPTYLLTQCNIVVHYLQLVFFPSPLVVDYFAWPLASSLNDAWLSMTILLLLTGFTVVVGRRHRWILLAWSWLLIILMPTSLVPMPTEIAAERRMYLPLAGILCLVIFGIHFTVTQLVHKHAATRLVVTVSIICAAIFGYMTVDRNSVYSSEVALWEHTLRVYPENGRAWNQLGTALYAAGETNDAIASWKRAIEAAVPAPYAYNNLGRAFIDAGQPDKALPYLIEAARYAPHNVAVNNNLAMAQMLKGQLSLAYERLQDAAQQNPSDARTNNNLGIYYLTQGNYEQASAHFKRAIAAEPLLAEAHNNLGAVKMRQGLFPEAVIHLRTCLEIDERFARAHSNLGKISFSQRAYEESLIHHRNATRLDDNQFDSHLQIGMILFLMGRPGESIHSYERALEIRPRSVRVRNNFGIALCAINRLNAGQQQFEIALSIDPNNQQAKDNLSRVLSLKSTPKSP